MATQTYDPSEVKFSMWGIKAFDFVSGTFIKITRVEASFTKVTGADGITARARNMNKAGKAEVTLKATSLLNSLWMAQALLDELTALNSGSMDMTDISSGATAAHAEAAWCEKIPDMDRAKEVGQVVWTFDLASPVDIFIAGTPIT